MNKRKARFSRPIIGIEGGGYMLLARAMQKVDDGRAVIVSGLVRFLKEDQHPGYEAAPGYARFAGSVSYDPDMGGGPTVVQFFRPKFEL